MSKRCIPLVSIAAALIALLASPSRLEALDVSEFLTQESSMNLAWGSPGGVAFGGTNFLIAAQSTNGRIMALLLGTNGVMSAPPLDLGRTGGLPRVAFDGGNYLVAWPDFGDEPSDIYGQFVRPNGTISGIAFLIEANVDADEVGGLAFDGTNYLAVWETNARQSNGLSSVQGRLITAAGDLPGLRLDITSGTTPQKFPDIAWNGEHYLVIWTGQSELTNEWNVLGRQLDREGGLMESVVISEHPAQQPWPPALASDGTNWLAAWSREAGPYFILNSNLWLPMLYGRIVGREGTVSGHEARVRWGGLGQFKPRAAFNGDNYLVGWMEKARLDEGPILHVSWFWQSALRELNSAGQPTLAEFWLRRNFNYFSIEPPRLAAGAGAGRFVVVGETLRDTSLWDSVLIRLDRSFALRNMTRLAGGQMGFDLVGPKNWSYGVEITTNLATWSPVMNSDYGLNIYPTGRITGSIAAGAGGGYFRAFDGQTACRENQRLIQQAKDHWAVEHNKDSPDTPVDSDLFGPGRYLPSKPVCPNGGGYTLDTTLAHPSCSLGAVAGHTY